MNEQNNFFDILNNNEQLSLNVYLHKFIFFINQLYFMIDDLNLSNILPWDTAETQAPINRLQLINNVVSQLPKEKNRLQQTKSIKAQLPQSITHRKIIPISSALKDSRKLHKIRTWSFNYLESSKYQRDVFQLSREKKMKLLQISSAVKVIQKKTNNKKEDNTQTNETNSNICSRYDYKQTLKRLPSHVIKQNEKKKQSQGMSFSNYIEENNKISRNNRINNKPSSFNYIEVAKPIHSRTTPEQLKLVVYSKNKTRLMDYQVGRSSVFQKQQFKTARKRLYSSKKCFKTTEQSIEAMFLSKQIECFDANITK